MTSIDNAFIITNFEEVDLEDNPDRLLCRYEFYEILVRIASEKYIKSMACKNMTRAVARILNDNIFKNSDFVPPIQQWRDDHLWTVHIDDLYQANKTSLHIIFNVRCE